MSYEIDFIPVGQGSSGGDAIALRWGNLSGSPIEQTVMVVDGGYSDSGQALVDHIRKHYGTDTVDFVVSTHPDRDHISGLTTVLEQLNVRRLLMHLPWNHSQDLRISKSSGFTSLSFSEKLEKSMQASAALQDLAISKGIPITEPFTGFRTLDGCFRVLGPSQSYYEQLLPSMSTALTAERTGGFITKAVEAVKTLLEESLHIETLRDDGVTRPSNNSSVISLIEVDGRRALLTGDAGIPALEQAIAVLEAEGYTPGSIDFVQIPHHGSRRNVGPTVLNRILGDKGQTTTHSLAFVSAPPENPHHKHPSKKVTNAFTRRGYGVHGTQGIAKWLWRGPVPPRENYVNSVPIPFHDRVEEDSEN